MAATTIRCADMFTHIRQQFAPVLKNYTNGCNNNRCADMFIHIRQQFAPVLKNYTNGCHHTTVVWLLSKYNLTIFLDILYWIHKTIYNIDCDPYVIFIVSNEWFNNKLKQMVYHIQNQKQIIKIIGCLA